MARILDLGSRLELVPMDTHCHEISIALYLSAQTLRVHTYSRHPAAAARVEFVRQAMAVLGGLVSDHEALSFPCGGVHKAAVRRVFLESCKLPSGSSVTPKPLHTFDKKSDSEVTAESLGAGRYHTTAPLLLNGLRKLAELDEVEPGVLAFPCGHSHDALIGLLMPRALNVRAILREEEAAATRGVLVAPSAQK